MSSKSLYVQVFLQLFHLVQLFPREAFATKMTVTCRCKVNGTLKVELANNPRADNRNDLALELARKDARLLALSGSDCHEPQDVARGGIELEILPENERQLCELLRARKYRLL